jgi:histidine triad (HIT) family protein
MSDCLFCKIIAGDIPADKLYEDDDVFAFRDISPKAPTHFLIIPKKHLTGVSALHGEDDALIGKLMRTAAKVAAAQGLGDGFRVVINDGADAGQVVFHIHMHVLGGRRMGWPPG